MFWKSQCLDHEDSRFYDVKHTLDLDEFGFPAIALTNKLLVAENVFGKNREKLEKNWQDWLNFNPFDADVAKKLVEFYRTRIARLDPDEDIAEIQRIDRKRQLAQGRAERYAYDKFGIE